MDAVTLFAPSAIYALLTILLPLGGAVLALTPYLMPKRECFAVTIPDHARNDARVRSYRRTFALVIGAITLILTLACALALAARAFTTGVAIMGFGLAGLCLFSFALMLFFRKRVIALKQKNGWVAEKQMTFSSLGDEPTPRPLSLKWDLLFLPLFIVSLAICLLGYPAIPEQIPTHIGTDGHVTTYVHKSIAAACFPALIIAFIDGILVFAHWQITRSKRFIDPTIPAASAWAYGKFARAQSALIVASGILLGFVGLSMALSFVGLISLGAAALWCLACVFIVAFGSIALSLAYGQNGSRLIAAVSSNEQMLRDNDRFWKFGIFYVNRNDPSLFLPERFGIGWTMNWGRRAAWLILLGLIIFIVVFLIVVFFFIGA